MKAKMRMEFKLLDNNELEYCFNRALTVWKEVPFRVQGTEEFFDYLTAFGCQVDGELVRFPQSVIDRVLARIAEEKEKNLVEQRQNNWPESQIEMFTHGQALHICDIETNKIRPATENDLARWCHLVDAIGDIDRTHPTFIPSDAPCESADFHAFATIILNSARPHRVSVYSLKMLPFFIEASKIAQGSMEQVKKNPIFATKCWVNSPFMITRESIEIALEARRVIGVPITFGHMPVAGASGPITIAGSLVQNTAEALALNAMRLAIDDLTMGITATSTIMDMKSASHRQSGPDLLLHIIAGAQMNEYLFGIKSSAIGVTGVAAQTVSAQSVYEKAISTTFNISAGQRKIGIGCLAFSDVGSPVQLILDYEMGLYFRHLFRDVNVDDEHIGLDTILSVAPKGGFFLETEHTAEFFREECWFPAFIDNRLPLAWMKDPTDIIERARKYTSDLYEKAENKCPLNPAQKQAITELIKQADSIAKR